MSYKHKIFWDDACVLLVLPESKVLVTSDEDLFRARTEVYRHVEGEERASVIKELTEAYNKYRASALEKAVTKFMVGDPENV